MPENTTPPAGKDQRVDELVMTSERGAHLLRAFLPQARRTLQIGEQERHRPRRHLRHDPNDTTEPAASSQAAVAAQVAREGSFVRQRCHQSTLQRSA